MNENDRRPGSISELGELRIRLDQMTERITSRFKDRSRFPTNGAIYQPDGVPIIGRSGVSLFQFAIEGLESYHASLGRFDDSDQHPVLGLNLPPSKVTKRESQSPLHRLDMNISDSLLQFYRDLVLKHCKPGDDPHTYGETAYLDADLVQMIHERVNIGRYVADVKGRSDPTIYQSARNEELLLSKLKDRPREEALINKVRNTAQSYDLNPDMVVDAFGWMIDKTLEIEIAYIQQANTSETT